MVLTYLVKWFIVWVIILEGQVMDCCTTKFEILRSEGGKIVGFSLSSAGTTEDEYFCEMLPRNINEGKASMTVSDGEIHIKSIGIGGEEEWRFNLYEDEEPTFQEIFSGLGKTYQGYCKTRGGFGVSFTATFREIPPLNKREWSKRKRSFWRNPIPTKNPAKVFNWERIHT
jgi:hypothetical protein